MNVKHVVNNNTLTLAIAIDDATIAAAPSSKSGKSKVVGSSNGFIGVGLANGKVVKYSLNVTTN